MRYNRPFLELEYDQQALSAPGCCKYVPVVLRLCQLPEKVQLTVMMTRARKRTKDGTYLDDYNSHPDSNLRVKTAFPGYMEYAGQLLARGHNEETGTISIRLESPSYSVLSEAVYTFDSRQAAPISSVKAHSFRGIRLLTELRTSQEREALRGQFPASLQVKELPPAGHPSAAIAVQQETLF